MEVKDFFYNLSKSLSQCINTLLLQKTLMNSFSTGFYKFIDCEYNIICNSQSKNLKTGTGTVIDTMMYANMIDSDEFKLHRHKAYSKFLAYLEVMT